MEQALLLAVLIALVVLIIVVVRARSRNTQRQPALAGPKDPFADVGEVAGDPRALKAGDMVEYLGRRSFVRGSLRLREGGFTWAEHFLDDPGGDAADRYWLSVEEDPDLEVVMWTALVDSDLRPSAKAITVEGTEYRRVEHGVADYRSEGSTGLGDAGRMEYADYEASGGRYLAFEKFLTPDGQGRWEASLGERIPAGTLTVYPGS